MAWGHRRSLNNGRLWGFFPGLSEIPVRDRAALRSGCSTSGTLSLAVGETTKTVSVAVLNDAHDEGSETLTLTLSNVTGAVISDGEATGTITNDDPIPQAWISRFGRTVAHQVLDAVDARMDSQPTAGLAMTLAGQPVDWLDGADESQPVEGLAANEDEGNGLTHQRLDLQLSYGFLALGDRFTLTPELGLGLYNRQDGVP